MLLLTFGSAGYAPVLADTTAAVPSLTNSQLKVTSSHSQFVTLYNPTSSVLNMSNYQLEYFNSSPLRLRRCRFTHGCLPWLVASRYYTVYMSTEKIWQTTCDSAEKSLAMAASIGQNLRGGEVIELVSDLGGGKTTFVRGLVQGMGSTDRVSSPSFTLTNQYQAGDLTLQHFDFYRLSEPGIMRQELAETIADPLTVTVVEWADIVEDVLPIDRMTIRITATGETSRSFDFNFLETLAYLLEALV